MIPRLNYVKPPLAVSTKSRSAIPKASSPPSLSAIGALGLVNPVSGFFTSLTQKKFASALVNRKISFAKNVSIPKAPIPKIPSVVSRLPTPKLPSVTPLSVPNTTVNLNLTQMSSPGASTSTGGFLSTLIADIQNFLTSLGL